MRLIPEKHIFGLLATIVYCRFTILS